MLLISSITHSALAFLHSYLTVRGDDEPPLLIQSHVSMVCGGVCVVSLWFLYDIMIHILHFFFFCTFSSISVFSVYSHTHKHTHRPQRSRVSCSSRQALLPNLDQFSDQLSHNACLWMGLMGRWLPGG